MKISREKQVLIAIMASMVFSANSLADSKLLKWSGNGHYYHRFDEAKISWASAQTKCKGVNGYLATLTSAAEQSFVEKNFLNKKNSDTRGYHIGGLLKDNKWEWANGEKWNYTHWYQGHPFNVGDRLGIYNDGYWLDKNMAEYIDGYICEWTTAKKK